MGKGSSFSIRPSDPLTCLLCDSETITGRLCLSFPIRAMEVPRVSTFAGMLSVQDRAGFTGMRSPRLARALHSQGFTLCSQGLKRLVIVQPEALSCHLAPDPTSHRAGPGQQGGMKAHTPCTWAGPGRATVPQEKCPWVSLGEAPASHGQSRLCRRAQALRPVWQRSVGSTSVSVQACVAPSRPSKNGGQSQEPGRVPFAWFLNIAGLWGQSFTGLA